MSAGGPYAIMSRSLGFEIGGSIGVPLYLSQALAVTTVAGKPSLEIPPGTLGRF